MPDILIRGLGKQTIERLKARAKRHGRSLQSEAKRALENAGGISREELAEMMANWKRRFAGRKFGSSVTLLREDRQR
jgi:plasmid stability protein